MAAEVEMAAKEKRSAVGMVDWVIGLLLLLLFAEILISYLAGGSAISRYLHAGLIILLCVIRVMRRRTQKLEEEVFSREMSDLRRDRKSTRLNSSH